MGSTVAFVIPSDRRVTDVEVLDLDGNPVETGQPIPWTGTMYQAWVDAEVGEPVTISYESTTHLGESLGWSDESLFGLVQEVHPAPEPSIFASLMCGVVLLEGLRRRKKR